MGNYRLTKRAERDIDQLYEYGLSNFGLEQAQSYFLGLHERFQILTDSPRLGREADELVLGLRRVEYSVHVIFYIPEDLGVLIVRVLRAEMDFKRHL
jgi:toxin ParE1/3/4